MLPKRDQSQDKIPTQTESEKLEKNIPNSGQLKKARVAILVSDKIDFKEKVIKIDPEGYFIIL